MAYTEVNKTERENYLYTFRRASLLSEIFWDNLRLSHEVDPFEYQHDVYDILLSEQYTLYDGGDDAVDLAKDRLQQLDDMKEEFADDEDVLEYIDMLTDEYNEYVVCYTQKGV